MGTTKIWPIKDSLSRVLDYAANPDKTVYSDLQKVLHYTEQRPSLQGARQRRDEQPDRERSGAWHYVAADRPTVRGDNRPI